MVNAEQLNKCLSELHTYNSKITRDTIETLLKIHRNILYNEDVIQYRKIKPQNPSFLKKIWSVEPARQFMITCGWLQVLDVLVFNNDESLIEIIDVLLEYRCVAPDESEWQEETKVENLNTSQKKEEELRRKAAIERQKQLEEYKKDKLFREQLAVNIKMQIADDRKNQRQFTEPAVANNLGNGARVKNIRPLPSTSNNASRKLGD